MTAYTEAEGQTLRTAVFGAMVLVSTADPGSVDEESHAGIRAMTLLSDDLRAVIAAAPPALPKGTTSDVEAGVLAALRESVAIIDAHEPRDVAIFRAAVTEMCRSVAGADGEVAVTEKAMVTRVVEALG
ncbi:TerB family tellurite resistance protein [Lentzea aerocolonigenes]|uniref:TerB family tellurite resistance protein n=1 Tax=Lentzea aerocolonigenes TaxID=68170 RepID=UPI0004C364D5|nr:TerB family tellurite resistance protein [Lentzea aerocolonigenes]MCP2241696.1 Tellurite resistance protein TerB [Lentzea aerocolonigenes]